MSINQEQRANLAWPILVECAAQNETITYSNLAKKLDLHHRAMSHILGVIQSYCISENLPPLTILVVSKSAKIPGNGFIAWDIDDMNAGLQEVYQFKWSSIDNPFLYAANGSTKKSFVEELISTPDNAREILSQVKSRGIAQVIFRSALLHIYEEKCAFCGLTFEDALEAAHIIPWAKASQQQRLDPRNGLLLCSTHHKLFDAGYMSVSASGEILYLDPQGKWDGYSTSDKVMTIDLHKKQVFLPKIDIHQPFLESLADHRNEHGFND